jgi:hypothetical protein
MRTSLHGWIVLDEGCGRVMRVEHVWCGCVGHVVAGYKLESCARTVYYERRYEKQTCLV